MKVRNAAPGRPERIMRGLASTLRSTGRGITLRDNGVDVEPVWDIIAGQGLKVTDLDDGLARLDAIGGTGPDGGQTGGGSIVEMLNNSGQDLLPGSVVVVDETADKAVTVTTTEGDTRIAGVVQEPIGIGDIGLVLFNGYTPVINAPDGVRGEYAKTSTTETQATSTADREAGSFAVYLTGSDFSEFVSSERTTTAAVPTTSLEIEMPPVIPADRLLFLALWLTDDASSIDVDDWTLIGAEAGFTYYYKIAEGDDTATATWTGASVAVATVLLLHPTVNLGFPIADHDYEDTGAAAEVTGLSDAPRYAIAGVKGDVESPGDGYVRLGGGTAGFVAGGSTTLVQSKFGDGGATGTSFNPDPTIGNMLVAIPSVGTAGLPASVDLYDPRDIGSCPAVTDWDLQDQFFGSTTGGGAMAIRTKIADETYAGPFKTTATCGADSGRAKLALLEFSGVSEVAAKLTTTDDQNGGTIDLGTFSGYGADDVIVMGVVFKKDGGGDPDVSFAAEGFTQLVDHEVGGGQFHWTGYKIGGTANAKVTHSGGSSYNWGAAAIHLTAGSQGVAGTLAGKYIGHDSSATSPFTDDDDDAIFAINLVSDAKPSALLYGPDLNADGGSEPTADAHIADTSDAHDASAISVADAGGYFTATDVEAAIAELAAKDIGYQAHGNMGATETFSAATGWHSGTFDADCTFTFSGATSGIVASMVLELLENGTGGFAPTWPGSVVWPGGVTPTHDETAGTTTIYLFQSRDGGTTWFGFQAGAGSSSVAALDDLSDVTITSPAEDEQLQYVGGVWVNNARRWEAVTDGEDVFVWESDDLVHEWKAY